jgi:hypothetical protein
MIVDNLFSSIARGKQGLNKGLSSGLPEFDTYTYGVQRRWMTVVAGDSGSGKSSLALYSHIYEPFMQYCNDSSLDIHFLLFSFEMSAEVLLAKLLSLYIYEVYGKILSYNNILSLTSVLPDEDYALIEESKPWLQKFESICDIVDKPTTAKGLYAECKKWSKKFGVYKEVERTDDYVKEEYVPNNPEQYLIVVVDHIKLLSPASGHTSKQEIDEACDYLIHFRNKCNFTITIVQQFNRNFKSMDRRTSENYLPSLEDLSDSGGPAQASETVIAIYHPHREKRFRCEGYDIRQLKDRARMLVLLKNRFGMSDKLKMTAFYGETGIWNELPKPEQICDYGIYQDL